MAWNSATAILLISGFVPALIILGVIARRAQAEALRRRHARGGAAKAAPLEDGVTAVAGADYIDGVFDPLALAAAGVGEVGGSAWVASSKPLLPTPIRRKLRPSSSARSSVSET